MSKREREAFLQGVEWWVFDAYKEGNRLTFGPEGPTRDDLQDLSEPVALRRYPDSPCKNVREIVVEYLKANGYKGLWNDDCWCHLSGLFDCPDEYGCEVLKACIPGILLDGKIVPKEST